MIARRRLEVSEHLRAAMAAAVRRAAMAALTGKIPLEVITKVVRATTEEVLAAVDGVTGRPRRCDRTAAAAEKHRLLTELELRRSEGLGRRAIRKVALDNAPDSIAIESLERKLRRWEKKFGRVRL